MLKCAVCNISTSTLYKFKTHLLTKRHINNVQNNNNLPTDTSTTMPMQPNNKNTGDNTELQENTATLNKKTVFICKCCNKKLYSKYNLERHISTCKRVPKILAEEFIIINNTDNVNNDVNNVNNLQVVDETDKLVDKFNYLYLIQKYDVNECKFIYKFGKTERHYTKRLKEHGNEAKLLLIVEVNNCNTAETAILKILNSDPLIKKCELIGNEYFCCEDKSYILNKILMSISLLNN